MIKDFINKNILNIQNVTHGSSFNPEIMDFSSSVIPLDIDINEIVNRSNIFSYPDSESSELRKVISEIYNIIPENIITGNGSSELLLYISLVFFSKGRNVLLSKPTYGEYKRIIEIIGAVIKYYTLSEKNDFKTEIDDYVKFTQDSGSDIVFLCNPNNPTGDYIDQDKMEYILKSNKEKLFIIDLAYIDYTGDKIDYNRFINRYNVIFVNSLTKSFGIAGLRSGYIAASKKFIAALNKVKIPWNMNVIAQNASIEILKNRDKYIANIEKIKNDSENLRLKIQKSGFSTISSSTDYFMIKVKDCLKVKLKLLEENILVRELASMELPEYIRIAGKDAESNNKFLEIWNKKIKKGEF